MASTSRRKGRATVDTKREPHRSGRRPPCRIPTRSKPSSTGVWWTRQF